MSDLAIGETVEIIKNVDGSPINLIGHKGIVDSRVSGGYKIRVKNASFGTLDTIVGSIDWQEYVKRAAAVIAEKSPVPDTLKKWYVQTQQGIKNT